ncbi:MAG: GPW/gp25 family protein [Streptosporangiaceae bacterium]|nr:GPW/gp25 family protein [Streptosporangiaceae bacterium]
MQHDFIGAGWAFPVSVDARGAIALARGTDELEQAMRLILMTYPGERPMRPEFGSRLRDFVFDGTTAENASAIGNEVRAALLRWEPRVDVSSVDVTPDYDAAMLYVDIKYTVKSTNDRRNLVFPFYTIPLDGEEG